MVQGSGLQIMLSTLLVLSDLNLHDMAQVHLILLELYFQKRTLIEESIHQPWLTSADEGSSRALSSGGMYCSLVLSINGERCGGNTAPRKYFSTGRSSRAFTESNIHCGCT